MYRGFAHADATYNADMEAAQAAYKAAGGNDSPQAIAEYRNAKSRAMQEAARRHAAQIRTSADTKST